MQVEIEEDSTRVYVERGSGGDYYHHDGRPSKAYIGYETPNQVAILTPHNLFTDFRTANLRSPRGRECSGLERGRLWLTTWSMEREN
jgi:hypothetical protein